MAGNITPTYPGNALIFSVLLLPEKSTKQPSNGGSLASGSNGYSRVLSGEWLSRPNSSLSTSLPTSVEKAPGIEIQEYSAPLDCSQRRPTPRHPPIMKIAPVNDDSDGQHLELLNRVLWIISLMVLWNQIFKLSNINPFRKFPSSRQSQSSRNRRMKYSVWTWIPPSLDCSMAWSFILGALQIRRQDRLL